MEKLVLVGIGLLALAYVARRAWRSLNGKTVCNCGEACSGEGCAAYRELCRKK